MNDRIRRVPAQASVPTRTAHSALGFGRLIVEYVDTNKVPKTGRLEDIATGTHVHAIGTITAVTPIPSLTDPDEPAGAWVILTATDGTMANLHVPLDKYLFYLGTLIEGTRVWVGGNVLEGDTYSPPLIEARVISARLHLVGGAR